MNPVQKTLIVFFISVIIALPLMALAVMLIDSELITNVVISGLGWIAGGAIVGTYVYLRK